MERDEYRVSKNAVDKTVNDNIVDIAKKKNYRNSPVIGDNGISATPGEIADITRNMLTIGLWPSIDINDPKQVADRVTKYFNYCIDNEIRPGNLGLYNALGIDKRRVSEITNGSGYGNKFNPESLDVIKKSLMILSSIRENLMSDGKINPITGIFWQKNWDGLQDKQEVVITPNQQLQATQTAEQIAESIDADVPLD